MIRGHTYLLHDMVGIELLTLPYAMISVGYGQVCVALFS